MKLEFGFFGTSLVDLLALDKTVNFVSIGICEFMINTKMCLAKCYYIEPQVRRIRTS